MNFALRGRTFEAQTFECTVGLQLSDQYFVRIESPFTLNLKDRSISLSPEDDPTDAFEPLRQLIGQTVTESDISTTGTLLLAFEGGENLTVEPDSNYEAWTVSGPDGLLIVCMPGGELAWWDPEIRDV